MDQQNAASSMRVKIAEEAAELFAESGYAAVSMRMIAGKLGIKAASLYNHYPDKESLYFAALARAFEKRIETIEEAMGDQKPVKDRLSDMLVALGRIAVEDPVSARLVQRELLDADENRMRQLTETLFQEPFARIIGLLKEAGVEQNPSTMALYLTSLIHGYFTLAPVWRHLKLEEPIPETPEQLGKDLSEGVTAFMGAS